MESSNNSAAYKTYGVFLSSSYHKDTNGHFWNNQSNGMFVQMEYYYLDRGVYINK